LIREHQLIVDGTQAESRLVTLAGSPARPGQNMAC